MVVLHSARHEGVGGVQGCCLTSYSRSALRKDWHLIWTRVPILERCATPSPGFFGKLGVRSPPPFDRVIQHLRALNEDDGEGVLSSWPQEVRSAYLCPPAESFYASNIKIC